MFFYCISPSAAGLGTPEIPTVPSSNAGTSHAFSFGWLLGRVSDPTSAQDNIGPTVGLVHKNPSIGISLLVLSCCSELSAHPTALLLLKLSSPGVQEGWGGLCCRNTRCLLSPGGNQSHHVPSLFSWKFRARKQNNIYFRSCNSFLLFLLH